MFSTAFHRTFWFLVLSLCQSYSAAATTWFISPNGSGTMDGSSWANAANGENLQARIDAANSEDEVWVACGTYKPTNGIDRNVSFSMKTGVAIYGSFIGNEKEVNDRSFECGPCSILSGEIGSPGNDDNSYTVVSNGQIDSTAILDGFVIRDGNDDRSPTSDGNGLGGGLYNHGYGWQGFSNPSVSNCVFTANSASWGGGAFNNAYNSGNTRPSYYNCVFYQNHAYREAGGMDTYAVGGTGSPLLKNVLFYGNTSDSNVGAMYAWGGNGGSCSPILINCVFVNNAATNGYGGSFIADSQNESGGGTSGSCVVTLENCIVRGNTATGEGPQFYIRGTNSEVIASYSNIDTAGQRGIQSITTVGDGNIFADPQFVNQQDPMGEDNCWLTVDDGLQLQGSSPLINSGASSNSLTYDIRNQPRTGQIDIGIYEYQLSTGIQLNEERKITIYPNPSTDIINVKVEQGKNTVQLINSLGQLIETKLSSGTVQFNVADLAPGLYVVSVNDGSKVNTTTVIVE